MIKSMSLGHLLARYSTHSMAQAATILSWYNWSWVNMIQGSRTICCVPELALAVMLLQLEVIINPLHTHQHAAGTLATLAPEQKCRHPCQTMLICR